MGNTANTSFPSRRDFTATSCSGFNLNSLRVTTFESAQHLNKENSSVKKHISTCQNKVYKSIEIIVLEKKPANLRPIEVFTTLPSTPERNAANSLTIIIVLVTILAVETVYNDTRRIILCVFYSHLYLPYYFFLIFHSSHSFAFHTILIYFIYLS